MGCSLCNDDGGVVLYRDAMLRVVAVVGEEGDAFRGFCRVIWNAHVKEMTDLDPAARAHFMQMVFRVEAALRLALEPEKMNLASLGNLTPHLHWHVIPRFVSDCAYPKPIWALPTATPPSLSSADDKESHDVAQAVNSRTVDARATWHDALIRALAA
jgi:diadenosine tetraphosphate (Ap4A) HIT family hydrolase